MFRKKYKYDYDADFDAGDTGFNVPLPPPPPVTRVDYLLALCLGVFVTFFGLILSPAGLHPSAWLDCAQAAGLRPPTNFFPGIWRVCAHALYTACGISTAETIIAVLGKVSLGFIAATGYLSFRAFLALMIRKLPFDGYWNKRLARALAVICAFALACADPIWSVCQAFTTQTFLVVLFMASTMLWIRFLRDGKLSAAYLAMFLSGLFTAETPLGVILMAVCWFLHILLLRNGFLAHVETVNLFIRHNSKWYLTFCGAIGFFIGVAINVLGFIAMDGLAAHGVTVGDIPLKFGIQYYSLAMQAASMAGWILGLGMAVVPFALVLTLVHRATDVEHFLKYQVGIVFFALGCCAYSQLASLQPLWFWTWIKSPVMVKSPLLLAAFSFMSALTLLCALAVLCVDVFCRDNRRIAQQYDPDSSGTDKKSKLKFFLRLEILVLLLALLVGGIVPARIQSTTAKMLAIMRDYVREIVTEAGDAKWIFTDGAFDCAIELEAAKRGKTLICIPLLPGPGARSLAAINQTMLDDEDRLSAQYGGPNLLRTWERDKPARMADSAVQLLFEVWKRSGKAYPPVSGVLARAQGQMTPAELTAGIRQGHALAAQILDLYAAGGPAKLAGRYVNDIFLIMQWRLARLARVRAEIFDFAGQTEASLAEVQISDKLDDRNESLRRIIKNMTRLRELTMHQVTPREGLQRALARADFAIARHYAEPILTADPDDPSANFGMGMSYFMEEQWTRAEEYLRRCLVRNPKEPAVWNNIAVVKLRIGHLDEAKEHALKALEIIPDSVEVKDTLAQIEKAIQIAATNTTETVAVEIEEK